MYARGTLKPECYELVRPVAGCYNKAAPGQNDKFVTLCVASGLANNVFGQARRASHIARETICRYHRQWQTRPLNKFNQRAPYTQACRHQPPQTLHGNDSVPKSLEMLLLMLYIAYRDVQSTETTRSICRPRINMKVGGSSPSKRSTEEPDTCGF